MKNVSKSEQKFQKVMHEFGQGELKSHGEKVTDQKQALAIAFSEARKIYPNYGMMKNAGEVKAEAVKGLFSLNAIEDKKFSGYTFGDDWNGWATPYFERHEANLIMEALGGTYKDGAYLFDDGYDGFDKFEKQTIETVDGPKEVYAIGAYSWTWNNDLLKNGGGITGDQAAALSKIYKTGTAKQLWEAWTPDNRIHFLMDHSTEYFELMGDDFYKSSQAFSVLTYDALPSAIRKSVIIHHAQGMYGNGGGVEGDQLQLLKDRLYTIAIDLEDEDEEMLARLRYDLMDAESAEVANRMVTNFENNELNKISDKKMVDQIKKAIGNYRATSISKTPQQVWKGWNIPERLNFIVNHTGKQHTPSTQEELANKAYIFLPKDIKQELNKLYAGTSMKQGGGVEEGIDLFEDYENIPAKVQKILDKYEDAFMDGDYDGLAKAKAELKEIGYTFEYYLDGQAYDLRKIGQKGKVEETIRLQDKEWSKADGGEVYIDIQRRKYVLIDTKTKERWANEYFTTPDEAIAFAKQNNIKVIDKPSNSKGVKLTMANAEGAIIKRKNADEFDIPLKVITKYEDEIGVGALEATRPIMTIHKNQFHKWEIVDPKMLSSGGELEEMGIILLEGEPTIKGQIQAREKALRSVEKEMKNPKSDIYPNMLKSWKESHEQTLKKLRSMDKPKNLSPSKQKLLSRINTLKAAKANAGAAAQKNIQKKIDVLQKQFDYNPSAKERAQANKGKFALDVPAKYSKAIYRKLWSIKVFPKVLTLKDTSSIVVSSKVNLNKAYEIYSDMLKEKKEKVPSLASISRKL